MSDNALPDALSASALLRLPAVMQFSGYGRSAIYAAVARQEFPAPVKLSPSGRAVAWRVVDLQSWSASRGTKAGNQR